MRNLTGNLKVNTIRLSLVDLVKIVYSAGFLLTGITLFIAGQLILNNTLYKESEFAGIGGSLGIIIQFIGIMSLFYGTLLSVIQIFCLLVNNILKGLETISVSDTLAKDNTFETYDKTLKFLNLLYILVLILPIVYIILNFVVRL